MKINLFVDNECHAWLNTSQPFIIRADQTVSFELFDINSHEYPTLFIEDYEIPLSIHYDEYSNKTFHSISGLLFRESFGLTVVSVRLGEDSIELVFEVLVKKINAQQVEDMIRYLTHKQDDIMRICLASNQPIMETSDPETILNTVDTFINTLTSCRLELQNHLKKRLIPIKQPAWKASKNSDIDPFDIIFNLDVLEPVISDADVVVNGRKYSITETEVTTLEPTANVKENAILLGGLYSMRRIITLLLHNIAEELIQKQLEDKEYESLSDVLSRLTSANMKQRCKNQLLSLDEFILYFEKNLGIQYQGECRPIITPFVRASRVYRRLFEQLHDWYLLGEPSLDGRLCLARLRSVSKIYEFVVLFKLIDYLSENNWSVIHTDWSSQLEFVPSVVIFERENITLTLNYEIKIHPYHALHTKHLDLVDIKHSTLRGEHDYWCPDFLLKLETNDKTVYLVFDAKYSTASSVKKYHLPSLLEKYFNSMAVYDAYNQLLKQDGILAVIALFPDRAALSPLYLANSGKYGVHRKPIKLPVVSGLSLLPQFDSMAYSVFEQLFEIAERQLS